MQSFSLCSGDLANTKHYVSCDNPCGKTDGEPVKAESIPHDSINESVTIDLELAAWARKKHGFTFGKIITAYEEGLSLAEPITIREGLIIDDFCSFVEKRFSKIRDLDFRLPRLSGYVLEYANNLRVECIYDLRALNKSYGKWA